MSLKKILEAPTKNSENKDSTKIHFLQKTHEKDKEEQ